MLKSQLKLTQSSARKQFQDATGYECFVNHVHLEDIFASPNVRFLLEQALALADGLVALKSSIGISDSLEYIIGSDEHEVNMRFHLLRPGETWIADDLEGYTEAVGVIRLV